VEESLLDDPGSLKCLYHQAVNDCQRGIIPIGGELREKLTVLRDQGNLKQFVRLCQQQADYGYEVLEPVVSDYPRPGTRCELKVGRRQIVLGYKDGVHF